MVYLKHVGDYRLEQEKTKDIFELSDSRDEESCQGSVRELAGSRN